MRGLTAGIYGVVEYKNARKPAAPGVKDPQSEEEGDEGGQAGADTSLWVASARHQLDFGGPRATGLLT